MKRICAWCKKEEEELEDIDLNCPVTHGICPDCAKEVLSFKAKPMSDFLDKFPGPVYMLDSELKIVSVNREGAGILGRDPADFTGGLVGEAFECKYSNMEKGCGGTIHCRTCTIRNCIVNTLETGQSNLKIPAYQDFHRVTGEGELKYLVSTEKVGEGVVVKIEMAV